MMHRFLRLWLTLCVIAGVAGFQTGAAAQSEDVLDLADVPLPVQALPESGYQILAGGFLDVNESAELISGPRNMDVETSAQRLQESGLVRTYVLDLVLPEDRAWQDSPAIAIVQTSVYVVDDSGSAQQMVDLLQNYANTSFVDERDPAVDGAVTIAMVGESGEQLRTVVSDGRVVIEIVSLDATGAPDETEHILIVEATMNRLALLRDSGGGGLSSQALTIDSAAITSNFAHAQQTGNHGLYRYRDLAIQPAIGEMSEGDSAPAPGMHSLYVGSQLAAAGSGTGLVSVWLGEFDSSDAAFSFFDALVTGSPGSILMDPFFVIDQSESWTEQGVLGVYRVTGTYQGQRYSGNVEIRQEGEMILAVGYRSIGAALPSTDITSAMMDHQLGCLESEQVCAAFDLPAAMPLPGATPVAAVNGPGSAQFGWSIPNLGPEWDVTEEFSEQGYDRIGIRNGMSIFELESLVNHHGDPVQCVLDELHLLQEFEEHSDIRLWEDANGNTEGGNTGDQAWTVYRVEPLADERADQEYVIRIDCFTLMPGEANLVMKHIAPVDFWQEESPKGDVLRAAIVLPASIISRGTLVLSAHDWRTTMILTHWIDRAA